jgi:hypothetical protein
MSIRICIFAYEIRRHIAVDELRNDTFRAVEPMCDATAAHNQYVCGTMH